MKAIWNNAIVAESNSTVVVESNHYFPPDSVKMEFLKKTGETYTCPWKGTCDYYDVTIDGKTSKRGAWVYPHPSAEARNIAGHFAFWQGIQVTK